MPQILTPDDLPCPQASEVEPVERRLIDAGPPYDARTIEQDERQYQTLSFTLSESQTASFRDWWRNTLHFGGSWFGAPDTWPTPAGLVVKVRRFITGPRWQYASRGYWLMTIDCEVRGESEIPFANDEMPLWLDTYTGAAGTLLEDHAQDIPWNESVWEETDSESNPQVRLDGAGNAVGFTPFNSSPTFARTDFSIGAVTLQWGYRLEVDFAIRRSPGPGGEGAGGDTNATFYRASGGSGQIAFYLSRAQANGESVDPPYVGVEFFSATSGFNGLYIDLPDDGAFHRISATVNEDSIVIHLDGVLQGQFVDTEGGGPLDAFNTIARYQHDIEATPGESEFIAPTDAISRSAIYGEVIPLSPFLFYDDGSIPAPLFSEFGSPIDISALNPIPWEAGVNVVNSDGSGSNESFTGDIVIPLYSLSGLPGFGEYFWDPATLTPPDSGDPENPAPPWPVPSLNGHNPYPDEWPNATHFLYLNYPNGAITLAGWPGGVFYLYAGNNPDTTRVTVITFLPNANFYPPLRVDYGNPT